MKYLFFILIAFVSFTSCKKKPKVKETSFEIQKVQLPQHSVDYFTFSEEEVQRYQTAFQELKAPVFVGGDVEILLFPFSEWILTASILKHKDYTNDHINGFLKYGGQLDKEQLKIKKEAIATKQGFTLATTQQELVNYFGEPTKTDSSETKQHLTWNYSMKENTKKTIALQPFLSNDLDYTIDAYFKEGKLKALIYAYQIQS